MENSCHMVLSVGSPQFLQFFSSNRRRTGTCTRMRTFFVCNCLVILSCCSIVPFLISNSPSSYVSKQYQRLYAVLIFVIDWFMLGLQVGFFSLLFKQVQLHNCVMLLCVSLLFQMQLRLKTIKADILSSASNRHHHDTRHVCKHEPPRLSLFITSRAPQNCVTMH